MAYRKRKYRRRGVPRGYRHFWKYKGIWKERKKPDGSWKIDFRASKGKKSKGYGNFKKGFRIHWRINADQYAVKTGKGTYQTRMIGTKRRIHSGYGKKYFKKHRKYR